MAHSDSDESLLIEYLCEDDEDLEFLFTSSSEDNWSDAAITDTDSSLDNEETERRSLVRCQNFVEEIVPLYDDIQFREHFRMSRATCNYVINEIKVANVLPSSNFGRPSISAEKAFFMTLWYLANRESYRQISDRFNVTRSAAHNHIKLIVKFLVSIRSTYIKWPNIASSIEFASNFRSQHNINGIIGAIDGSHINILRPNQNQHVYCNRKGDHSILLQGVCDYKKRFIDIFCGEAGSIHDARLLKRSKLFEEISEGRLIMNEFFLLGDSAYPNLSWLVPPFKDNGRLTENQKMFNFRHSSTRIVIENAFGLLKGRFRRLKYFENRNIHFITEAVVAACVLHNICINFDDFDIEFEPESHEAEEYNATETFNTNFNTRQKIFSDMFNLN